MFELSQRKSRGEEVRLVSYARTILSVLRLWNNWEPALMIVAL